MTTTSRSRILIVASFPESILVFRGPLISALQAVGVDVHVAVPDLAPGSELHRRLLSIGVEPHRIPLKRTGINPAQDACTVLRLWQLMKSIRPDIVLGYTIKPVIYGSIAAWLAGVPKRYALITGLGYAFQGAGRRRAMLGLVERMYAMALSGVQKVFFQNPDDQSLFRARGLLGVDTPSVVVNGSGVDLALFLEAPIPTGPLRFLMIARLMGDKGVREYAQAAQRVHARYPETKFSLVGWIDENPDSIRQSELDVWIKEGVIQFHGRVSSSIPALTECSVYVLPSYREGTPRTVLEAMALGRPIITTDAPGCRETVIEGANGFLVPVKSVDALVDAMERFVNSPDLITSMGRRSRDIAVEKYDVHKINAVMLREMYLLNSQEL